jgi:hypothetical protein
VGCVDAHFGSSSAAAAAGKHMHQTTEYNVGGSGRDGGVRGEGVGGNGGGGVGGGGGSDDAYSEAMERERGQLRYTLALPSKRRRPEEGGSGGGGGGKRHVQTADFPSMCGADAEGSRLEAVLSAAARCSRPPPPLPPSLSPLLFTLGNNLLSCFPMWTSTPCMYSVVASLNIFCRRIAEGSRVGWVDADHRCEAPATAFEDTACRSAAVIACTFHSVASS